MARAKPRDDVLSRGVGQEPELEGVPSPVEMMKAFSWYRAEKDHSDYKKWTLEYVKRRLADCNVKLLGTLPEWRFTSTIGAVSRLDSRGVSVDPEMMARHVQRVRDLVQLSVSEDASKPDSFSKPSVKDNMRDSASSVVAEVEAALDELVLGGYFEPEGSRYSCFDYLRSINAKRFQAEAVLAKYSPQLEEVRLLKSRKDPQLNEGYKLLSRAQVNSLLEFLERICADAARFVHNSKAEAGLARAKRPRKKKAKTAAQLIKHLKYCRAHGKLASIDPASAIGASQLLTYNHKTRRLTVYVSRTRDGLTFKGTSVTDFDADASQSKTLRASVEDSVIDRALSCTKLGMAKVWASVKTKSAPANGRVGPETLVLRAIK